MSLIPSDLNPFAPSLQLASRCRDARIHLLLAQCNGEMCEEWDPVSGQ